jgi:two-component system, OmpR family, phosphate regulon sensor histidine kinase PhoR
VPKKILGTLTDQLIDTLDEACIGVDKEGRIQFANPRACAVLNLSPCESRGVKIWDATTVSEFTRAFAPLIKDSGAMAREMVLGFPEGRAYLVQMSPVRGSEGRLTGAVAVLRDVTSLKRIEKDVTALVQRISQELKIPLTSIKGYVETLLEGAYTEPAVCKRFLQIMNEETNRMARLLVGLLDAAGQGPAPPQPLEVGEVQVSRVIRRVADSLAPFARQKALELVLRVNEPLAKVKASESLLEQALTNLLDNAIKFTGLVLNQRGKVTVLAHEEPGRVVVTVQDNGVGIDTDEQERVFERFYRVRKGPAAELGGTGLGLTIARDIIQGAGGKIQVQSQLGVGSAFTVLLPTLGAPRLS